jgi:hypothetical protein
MATRRVVSPQSRDRYPYVTPVLLEQYGVLATLSRWRPRVQIPYRARPVGITVVHHPLKVDGRGSSPLRVTASLLCWQGQRGFHPRYGTSSILVLVTR